MDKQQALEKAANERGISNGTEAQYIRGFKNGFSDAWDAQQSPSDAVAFQNWIDNNGYYKTNKDEWYCVPRGVSKFIAANTADLYKLFNPSGAATLAEGWAIGDKAMDNMLRDQESLKTAPQAAGPVWVKPDIRYNNNLPPAGKDVFIRYDNGSIKDACDAEIIKALYWKGFTDIEWLNETNTQQVFTWEQMQHSFEHGVSKHRPYTFVEYMNTNYPETK